MWKKEEHPEPMPTRRPEPELGSIEPVPARKATGERATIGRSITINGEVNGDEDLLIQGRVEGSVTLKQHAVTVGSEGEVKADIGARVITVEGTVKGNLTAQEQVVLRGSARVQGNITAPRVVLEDGARFRGGVDMGEAADEAKHIEKTAARTGATGKVSDYTPEKGTNASSATSHAAASASR